MRRKHADYYDHLLRAVPAESYDDIAQKMSRTTRETIDIGFVANLLNSARKRQQELGFVIHYADRGPNLLGAPRFIPMPLLKNGEILDRGEVSACLRGQLTILSSLLAQSGRQAEQLLAQAMHTGDLREIRKIKATARRVQFLADEAAELVETYRDRDIA